MLKLVSVVVPTFNRREAVLETIDSLRSQTYPSLEIIVVDDGSDDGTEEAIAALPDLDRASIVYHRQANSGCASARNKGLELSSGELFSFLDSDDWWVPTAAETMVDALQGSSAAFVYTPAVEVLTDGSESINYPVAAGRPAQLPREHFMTTNLRNGAAMFRREVLDDVDGLDERLGHNEDSDFVQRVAIRYPATYSEAPTVRVRHHEGNKSRNRAKINEALLTSAERVLAESPTFAQELGEDAERRVSEIRSSYVEALAISGRTKEAAAYQRETATPVRQSVRLALRLQSRWPMLGPIYLARIRTRGGALRRRLRRAAADGQG